MPAITFNFRQILISRSFALFTAIIRIAICHAVTHFVSAFVIIVHLFVLTSLLLKICCC